MEEKLIEPISKLKEMRQKKKVSVYDLADKVGISVQRIQHYESKYRNINKAEALVVYNIANVLGCDISEILEIPDVKKKRGRKEKQ